MIGYRRRGAPTTPSKRDEPGQPGPQPPGPRGIPPWASRVEVEFEPGAWGGVRAGRRGGRLLLRVPEDPGALLSSEDKLGEAAEAAAAAWSRPGRSGLWLALTLTPLASLVAGLLDPRLASWLQALAFVAAVALSVLAYRGGSGSRVEAWWVGRLVRAAAELAVSCRRSGRCVGVYPLLGSVYDYSVRVSGESVLVQMRRRGP